MLTSFLMIFIATDLMVFMMWLTDLRAPQNKSRLAWWILAVTASTVVIMVGMERLLFPVDHPGLTVHSAIAFVLATGYVYALVKVVRYFKHRFRSEDGRN